MPRPNGHRADASLLHHSACLRHCRLLENSPVLLRPSKQHSLYFLQDAQQLSEQISRKDSLENSCCSDEVSAVLLKGSKGHCFPLAFPHKHAYYS